jgi:hypothetical protein
MRRVWDGLLLTTMQIVWQAGVGATATTQHAGSSQAGTPAAAEVADSTMVGCCMAATHAAWCMASPTPACTYARTLTMQIRVAAAIAR